MFSLGYHLTSSYALLTEMMAQVCGLKPGVFVHTIGDAHLYNNTLNKRLQITREPLPLPKLRLNHEIDIDKFDFSDIEVLSTPPHLHQFQFEMVIC